MKTKSSAAARKLAFRGLGLVAPEVAAGIAERLFMTPLRFETPERERKFLATGKSFSVAFEEHQLAGWSWGPSKAPAVLLMHGWAGRAGQLAAFVEPLLAAGYQVVAFDAPGHGASSGRISSLVHFARSIEAVVRELSLALHAVVAHSMGGAATAFALSRGLALQKLVFLGTPGEVEGYARFFQQEIGASEEVMRRLRERMTRKFGIPWEELSVPKNAPRFGHVPLLAVYDLDDEEVSWRQGHEIVRAWPGAELVTTTRLGHRKILRDAGVVRRVVAFVGAPGA